MARPKQILKRGLVIDTRKGYYVLKTNMKDGRWLCYMQGYPKIQSYYTDEQLLGWF